MLAILIFGFMALAFSQFLAAVFSAPDTAGTSHMSTRAFHTHVIQKSQVGACLLLM